MSNVNMQCLPHNIDLNDLSFSDEQWYGFSDEQRDAVTALRRLRGSGHQPQLTDRDDISSLGGATNEGQNNRHVYQLTQLPPAPTNNVPIAPQNNPPLTNNNHNSNSSNSGAATRSTQAGNAFSRG
jgi:hypothetical protein